MQDNPVPRKPRVFHPRACVDCPAPFVPAGSKQTRCPVCQEAHEALTARDVQDRKNASRRHIRADARQADPPPECSVCGEKLRRNNTLGRCQEHRHIGEGMGTCGHGDCGKKLRRDNKIGYCEEHKYATSRAPVRTCAKPGCDHALRADNESGYCGEHASLTAASQEYRERYYERLREETAQRPDTRAVCSRDDCDQRLRSDNTTGRCREHHYEPVNMPECSLDGCTNRLTATNQSDRCWEHRAKHWVARICAAEDCGKTINEDCVTGYCREHRSLSEWRETYNREYYQERKVEFQESARQWRLANAEEHRAAVRAWNAANPAARQSMHARRRVRVQVEMTAQDRRDSTRRREQIAADPCFYCGKPETAHTDHFFPLDKGGTDHWWNLVRSCARCNLSKNATCGTAFLLRTGLLVPAGTPPVRPGYGVPPAEVTAA